MGVVSPSEGNHTVGHSHESRVSDGNAVSIAREIGEDLRGPGKGSLGINHPVAMRRDGGTIEWFRNSSCAAGVLPACVVGVGSS